LGENPSPLLPLLRFSELPVQVRSSMVQVSVSVTGSVTIRAKLTRSVASRRSLKST
jgi:hypothetical protein